MNHTLTLRPGFHPLTIILMVLGFLIAWPLGLLMLAYILWGDKIPEIQARANARGYARNANCFGSRESRHQGRSYQGMNRNAASGNAAFDDYRERELRRLDEERRRLDQERQDFEAYVANLRRAKDQEEFDRFMGDRNAPRENPGAA